jgi:hypothetical protein
MSTAWPASSDAESFGIFEEFEATSILWPAYMTPFGKNMRR